jgi:protein-S-isoprenylcysteine O-methyltransferase Ste14
MGSKGQPDRQLLCVSLHSLLLLVSVQNIKNDLLIFYKNNFFLIRVFQTLTTVGFGDITAETTAERIFSIVWMILGVGMFSFAIGNVGSILSNIDKRESELREKINQFNEFTNKVKLPNQISFQIRQFYE